MGNSVTVGVPYATSISILSFANAGFMQRVTVSAPGVTPIVWQGTGYYDTPLGRTVVPSPAGTGDGFEITVQVDHSTDGGASWQPSDVDSVECELLYLGMWVVVSEDSGDDTWDDATTYLMWAENPQAPAAPSNDYREDQLSADRVR